MPWQNKNKSTGNQKMSKCNALFYSVLQADRLTGSDRLWLSPFHYPIGIAPVDLPFTIINTVGQTYSVWNWRNCSMVSFPSSFSPKKWKTMAECDCLCCRGCSLCLGPQLVVARMRFCTWNSSIYRLSPSEDKIINSEQLKASNSASLMNTNGIDRPKIDGRWSIDGVYALKMKSTWSHKRFIKVLLAL